MSTDKWYAIPRNQRLGIFALIFGIGASLLSWRFYQAQKKPQAITNDDTAAWGQLLAAKGPESAGEQAYETSGGKAAPFDPNTAGQEALVAAGIPPKTAATLIKYRNKGAKFYRKEDLKRVYGITEEIYLKVAPYIYISKETFPDVAKKEGKKEAPATINLNQTDAATLILLKGIGPAYARRIIEFRDKLGGFYKVEQLREVYGFPDSTYQQLKDRFIIDASAIRKIKINHAGEEELTSHPYIRKSLAASIIKLRNDLKQFSDIEQLRQVPLINEEKYRKIAPYLDIGT